jgi:uncharacterized protein YxjI
MTIMKLIIKQQFLTLFDEFDVYDENDNIVFTVKGQFALTKTLSVYDTSGNEIAKLSRRFFSFLPTYDIEIGGQEIGSIRKEISLFKPHFDIDYMDWDVTGNYLEWDYDVVCKADDEHIAHISKEIMHLTDTYCIDVEDDGNILNVLLLVLAIDAEKSER